MTKFTMECIAIAVAVVTIAAFATVVTSWVAMAVVAACVCMGLCWFITFIEEVTR